MIISSCADKLRCPHCQGMHGSTQWPKSGDLVPFYIQKEAGNFNLKVTCPHCGKAWYVVWDDDPGPTEDALGGSAKASSARSEAGSQQRTSERATAPPKQKAPSRGARTSDEEDGGTRTKPGFWTRIFGSGSGPELSVVKQLEKARQELAAIAQQDGRVAHPIGQKILQGELQGLQQNLAAAVEALQKAGDGGSKSIGSHDVGVGLGRLCDDTLHDPKWALQKNVGTERCRTRVAAVLRTVERIAKQLQREQKTSMNREDLNEALPSALETGNLKAVEHFLNNGGDPNTRVDANSLPLHKAIRYGYADIATLLIRHGADVNGKDTWGCTPLHYAVVSEGPGGRCLPDVATLLLQKGADVNARSKDAWSPLMSSLDNGQQEMAALLRRHGAQK